MKIYSFLCCMILIIACCYAEDNESKLIKISDGFEYYMNPLEKHCGAGVSPHYDVHANIYQEFECIKAGHKHIYWGEVSDISDPTIQDYIKTLGLKQITFDDKRFVGYKHSIVYTASHERNALLLQKHSLESMFFNTIPHMDSDLFKSQFNPYFIGTLLEYKDEDMEYFYKRSAVLSQLIDIMGDRMMLPYKQWTAEEQKQFDELVVANQNWKTDYEKDKNYTDRWLALNKSFSVEDLRYQNELLEKYLNSVLPTSDSTQQTAVEDPVKNEVTTVIQPSEKVEVSWWKSLLDQGYQFFRFLS